MTNPTFRVSSGLLDPKHVRRMRGEKTGTVWVYLWCLNRQTSESGAVLGGSPVQVKRIVAELGVSEPTVRRHLTTLIRERYLTAVRTPNGLALSVEMQKKFRGKDVEQSVDRSLSAQCDRSLGGGAIDHLEGGRSISSPHSKIKTPEVTPEKRQGVLVTPSNTSDRAVAPVFPQAKGNNGGRPHAPPPCSRCGGPGASGTPRLCAACHDTFRALNREAGLGVPEAVRRMAAKFSAGHKIP